VARNTDGLKKGNPATRFHNGDGGDPRLNASECGKKSGEVRRKKREVKEKLKILLETQATEKHRKAFEKAGFDLEGDEENADLVACSIFLGVLERNPAMIKVLLELTGQDPNLNLKSKEIEIKEKALQSAQSETSDGKLEELIKAVKDI